jgi:hypothetical protein
VPATAHRPQVPPRAPSRIQARRVFLLARLLTAVSAVVSALGCSLAWIILRAWVAVTPGEDHAPQIFWIYDLRFWVGVFLAWTGVIYCLRKPLRLDAVDSCAKP